MKILMFGWEFPPNISGGLGTACEGILHGLSSFNDVSVKFVVPKTFGNENTGDKLELISAEAVAHRERIRTRKFQEYVDYVEIPSELSPYLTPESYQKKFAKKTRSEFRSAGSSPKIAFTGKYGPSLFDEIRNYADVAKRIAGETEFDVIHAHDWLTFPAAAAAKQISGKPLIVHIHSTDFDRSGGSANPLIYSIEKKGMEAADHIITVSNLIKKRLTDQYHITSTKITTVYNAVEGHAPLKSHGRTKKKDQKIVTFLGRLTIQKGPEYFVNVARMVAEKIKNVHFIMAGSGEMKNRMVELCAKYRLGDRFHFTGFLTGNEVDEILSVSDVVVMPSVSEPFGIVPLEAMKAHVPVVISKQSGVAELVKRAIKTDFWDVHAIADAVHGILTHPPLSKILSKEGDREVAGFNWAQTASKIRSVYLNTISFSS